MISGQTEIMEIVNSGGEGAKTPEIVPERIRRLCCVPCIQILHLVDPDPLPVRTAMRYKLSGFVGYVQNTAKGSMTAVCRYSA